MKYLPAFALFFAGAFAQQIHFSYPKDSSMIPLGETVVSINQPASPTSNENLILVLSVAPCPHGTCPYPYDQLGRTLYSGPFNPQYPKFGTPDDQPQQNFTVTIPDDLAGKQVQLSAVSLSLNGAGPTPLLQIKNTTVYVSYS